MAEPTTKLQGQSTPLTDKPKDEVKVTPAAPPPKAPVFTPAPSGVRPGSGQDEGKKPEEQPTGGMGWRPPTPAKPPTTQRPSLGRIVLYHHDLYAGEGGCAPAIVTGICESGGTEVDLTVFFKNQAPYGLSEVKQGDDVGMWNWPPKVG